MIKSNRWSGKITKNRQISPPLPLIMIVVALLLGGGIGVLLPSILSKVSPSAIDKFGGSIETLSPVFWGWVVGTLIIVLLMILRQNELVAAIVIASSIVIDLYLGLYFVSLLVSFILLLTFFVARSLDYPWIKPPVLWLWVLFLALAIFPATHGISLFDSTQYYLRIFFSAFIIFWLGALLARDITSIRRLLNMLYIFGMSIAIITIIQVITGKLLFSTPRYDAQLQSVAGYQLGASGISRAGAFLINPDPNACFLAMMLMLGLGLLMENPSLVKKVFYFAGSLLIALAVLFTFSTEGMLGAISGSLVLVVLVGRMRYRVSLLLLLIGTAVVIYISVPTQIHLLLQHAGTSSELQLRIGAWQTGIRVIQAFPLTGLGLGNDVYRLHAEPYRVSAQYTILNHPHDAYLEWATLGGIPILIVFLALLSIALRLALNNWRLADVQARPLLGAGIAVVTVLSFYSLSDAGWTFTPLAAFGWLMLGLTSSPLPRRREKSSNAQKDRIDLKQNS